MRVADVSEVVVPRSCIDDTYAHLRCAGLGGNEGLALWVGRQEGGRFSVTQAFIPKQRHIRTQDGVCVMLEADELHRMNVWLFKERLTLMAQVHSHPGRAYHSGTDDAYAVATTVGCLSIVVPDFASAPFDISRLATYRLDARARWIGVPPAEARRLIRVEG